MPRLMLLTLLLSSCASVRAGGCEPNLERIDALLEQQIADRGLAGAAVTLFDRSGTTLKESYLGGYGPGSFVPIASATKALSAAVIMSLVDDGTLSLDDSVADYLPQFESDPIGAATVRQLFSQTAGLWNLEWPCIEDPTTTLHDCAISVLTEAPRVSAPGESFFYGGNSMQVAARLAEIAYCDRFRESCAGLGSGEIWIAIFDERIRAPLGISMFFLSPTNPRIAGGLFSRLSDYRAFWQMLHNDGLYDGSVVLSTEAVAEMIRDQTFGAPVIYSAAQPDVRYGLGIWRFNADISGERLILSDPGKFGFHPWIDVDLGVAGIVMLRDPVSAAEGGGRHLALQIERVVERRLGAGSDDLDGDGLCDAADRCPAQFDPGQQDLDGDGAGDACDCAMTDPRLWSAPGETASVRFFEASSCVAVGYDATGATTCLPATELYDWFQPADAGALATELRYDLIRSSDPASFGVGAICTASAIERSGPYNADYQFADPSPGGLFAYLPRARNGCAVGSAGDGRTVRPCN